MSRKEALIAAYILDGKGGGKKIGWKEIEQWQPEQGYLWVHLNHTTRKARQWLLKESGLDKLTAQAMVAQESRPRSVINHAGLLVFLRGINLNPGREPEDMISMRIWINHQRIITARKEPTMTMDDLFTALETHTGPKSPSEFLVTINDLIINKMEEVLEAIDDQSDKLEEEVMTTESYLLRPKIADIRRQAIEIRRYLAPQREALYRLQIEKTSLLNVSEQLRLREATDRVIRYIEDLDSIRDRAAVTQEELSSRLSEQMDRRMYILSVVAVIFFPLTFLTGLLGINVGGIPGAGNKWGFLSVCIILAAVIFVTLWLLRRKKWM